MPRVSDEFWEMLTWAEPSSICSLPQTCWRTRLKTAAIFVTGHFTICCFMRAAARDGKSMHTERSHPPRKTWLDLNRHEVKEWCPLRSLRLIRNGRHSSRF